MSNFISVDRLYYAVMTGADLIGVNPIYSTPKMFTPTAKIDVDPSSSQVPYYADGVNQEMAQITSSGKVTIQGAILTLATQADIHGHKLDGQGGLIYNQADKAPYIAIFYRRTKVNGKFRYIKLYKCMFTDVKDAAATSDTAVKAQDDTIEGTFFSRISDGDWKYVVDEEEPGYVNADTTFFTSVDGIVDVILPTIASTVPAASATAVAVGTTYQFVMSEQIVPETVTTLNFYLIKDSDASIVGASVAYNSSTKTITLTPTVALSSASKYLAIVDGDVKDLSGNHIVPITKVFTTA